MLPTFFVRKFCVFLCMLSLTSCMVGPDFETPAPPAVDSYTETPLPEYTVAIEGIKESGAAQKLNYDADIPADWWNLFHSPKLNNLIERGLANNPNLQSAMATLHQAEESLWALVGSTMLPAVNGNFTKQRVQNPPFDTTSGINIPGLPPDLGDFLTQKFPPFNLYNSAINVSYMVDVFGGNRRAVEAMLAQVNYQKYELLAAYLTITGNIVTTAITEASLRAQIKATQDIIDIEQKQLEIVRQQFKLGGVSNIDVLSQEAQLEQTRATLPLLQKALVNARNAMAVLVGEFAADAELPDIYLHDLHLPENIPVSLPSKLVRQRPDIQAAEALLHASSAQIGVATANLLPQLNLTGTLGSITGNYHNLFGPNTQAWSWQAQVTQAFFNGGALVAQREAAIAAFKASYAQYQLAVLTAFQNVGDALSALAMDAEALQANVAAEKAAKETLDMVEKQYLLGGVSYLNLLYVQMQYHQAYMARVTSEAARYTDTAALFQAMGGGWWNIKKVEEIDNADNSHDESNITQ